MGLGKTLQILTLAARARQDDPDLGPVLVVAPVTLLENWRQEAEKFFIEGSMPVRTLYGAGLKEFKVRSRDVDAKLRATGLQRFLRPGWQDGAAIVLTTYETLRDYEFSFAEVSWSIVACDEAQRIKNPNALVSRAAKKLNARFCIAATGTPVENNLTDLWSLFDFIQPGLLAPLNQFNKRYRKPIENEADLAEAQIVELRNVIDPQVLRRLKSDIAADLPEKQFDQACRDLSMTERQAQLYRTALAAQESTKSATNAGTALLNLISVLRRVCTDPRSGRELDDPLPPLSQYRQLAPKLDWLIATLEDIQAEGQKAIVFMDRKDIQRLVQHYVLERFGFAPEIINGETPTSATDGDSRQRRVDRFQSRPGFSVLILSPVAAGVGLNIQEANHVIHYMRHWNPAKEDQATDRAYRIGQQNDVVVYTPIVVGDGWTSFDERLDELLSRKRKIADDMLIGSENVDLEAEFADLVADGNPS
jgi:SNF2 family DNA or RNA helicase